MKMKIHLYPVKVILKLPCVPTSFAHDFVHFIDFANFVTICVIFTGSEFSPIPSGRSIPRTPLVECNVEIMDKVGNQGSPEKVETDKLSVIPKGNSIPRSPIGK